MPEKKKKILKTFFKVLAYFCFAKEKKKINLKLFACFEKKTPKPSIQQLWKLRLQALSKDWKFFSISDCSELFIEIQKASYIL